MIELFQVAYSPFCIVQSRILDYAGVDYQTVEIPYGDRSLIWELTRRRYYAVPILKSGDHVVFETDPDSQVIAKFVSHSYQLDLFPPEIEGRQYVLWEYLENQVEAVGFKLNDIHFQSFVSEKDQLDFIRHKERKFGPGCIQKWKSHWTDLSRELETVLSPLERTLEYHPFLLGEREFFVDFCLFGMLGNYLYSGHNELPLSCPALRRWYDRMKSLHKNKSL